MRAFKVRRNGEQYYRVDLPRNLFTDGKRHSVMAVTRKEAIDKAQDTIARRRKGLDYSAAQTPLSDFLKRFLEYYKTEGGVSLRTWQDYRYHVEARAGRSGRTVPRGGAGGARQFDASGVGRVRRRGGARFRGRLMYRL